MRKHRCTLIFVICTIAIACFAWMLLNRRATAPIYQGRSLDSWITQLDDGDRDHETGLALSAWPTGAAVSKSKAAATEAIRQIGTNAIPFLVAEVTRNDPRTLIKLKNFLRNHTRFGTAGLSNRIEKQKILRHQAALGLAALGPDAKPALPELMKAFHTSYHTKQVTISIAAIEPEGWIELTKAITNSNESLALHGIWGLGMHRAAVPGTIDALLHTLTNSSSTLIDISAWALGEIRQEPERVVPALISALDSPSADLRRQAVSSLGKFRSQAESAIPALRLTLEDQNNEVRRRATKALKAITATSKP